MDRALDVDSAPLLAALGQRRRQFAAEVKLLAVRQFDELVESYADIALRAEQTAATIEQWRSTWRTIYESATGVSIEQHETFKLRLDELRESGAISVEELVTQMRATQSSRLRGLDGREAESGEAVSA